MTGAGIDGSRGRVALDARGRRRSRHGREFGVREASGIRAGLRYPGLHPRPAVRALEPVMARGGGQGAQGAGRLPRPAPQFR